MRIRTNPISSYKIMAKEIEKKYLVIKNKLPELKNGEVYLQGYLCLSPLIRFRVTGDDTCINIKNVKPGKIIREEFEFHNQLTKEEVEELKNLAVKRPIQKIRYKIEHKGMVWEIDVYKGDNEGLITAELEMPNEDFKPDFPDWLDRDKDITNDENYFNRNLGDHPYKEFKNEL